MVIQEDTICAIVTPPGIGGISVIRLSGKDAIAIASGLFHTKSGELLTNVKTHTLHYGYIIDPQSKENENIGSWGKGQGACPSPSPRAPRPVPYGPMEEGFPGGKIDEVLVSIMRSPHSFTCEDVVEISCHGGPFITIKILETFLKAGARLAAPGEFTKRAFLNGRIDLAQAEAVIDMIRARTDEGLRCALWQLEGNLSKEINMLHEDMAGALSRLEAYIDFPEDDIDIPVEDIKGSVHAAMARIDRLIEGYYRWRPFREGVSMAIVGRTNVGKSSLLNTLIGEERAIVTPYPGTTRDIVDGMANVHGLPLRLLDTAGLRMTRDMAEEEGIKRTHKSIDVTELILLILDGSEPLTAEDRDLLTRTANKKRIIVVNKIDIGNRIGKELDALVDHPAVYVSALKREGIEELKKRIREIILGHESKWEGGTIVTNLRHKVALEGAKQSLHNFLEALDRKLPLEIQAFHLREAMDLAGEITGAVTTEDILDRIFSEFCIGK